MASAASGHYFRLVTALIPVITIFPFSMPKVACSDEIVVRIPPLPVAVSWTSAVTVALMPSEATEI